MRRVRLQPGQDTSTACDGVTIERRKREAHPSVRPTRWMHDDGSDSIDPGRRLRTGTVGIGSDRGSCSTSSGPRPITRGRFRSVTRSCSTRGTFLRSAQHAREEGARPSGRRRAPRASVRARHRSGRRGVRQPQPARRVADRATRSGGSPTSVMRSFWTRSRMRRSISPAIRCCTRPRRCTPSSSTRRCTRKRCSTCGISCRTSRSRRRRMRALTPRGRRPSPARVAVPAGRATLGARAG